MPERYWIIVLSVVCGFWILLAIFLAFFCGPHLFVCHLCEVKIPRRLWQSGAHRGPCAQEHERFLHELPDATQKSAKCAQCGRTLKVSMIMFTSGYISNMANGYSKEITQYKAFSNAFDPLSF